MMGGLMLGAMVLFGPPIVAVLIGWMLHGMGMKESTALSVSFFLYIDFIVFIVLM